LAQILLSSSLILCALAPLSCRDEGPALSEIERQVGYPSGPWWRDPGQLNELVLAGSIIAVTHRDANPEELKQLLMTPRERSREEALRLTFKLRQQIEKAPEDFAALARQHSDDPRTAHLGGKLGAFRAPDVPPPVIDAFGNTQVGKLSRIVETPAGLYFVLRSPVPAAEQLAARQIVVKYAGNDGWRRPGRSITRTRVEARRLAERLAAELKKNPSAFQSYVTQYSDSYDAVQGGDFGSWSTHEAAAPVLLSALASLRVGETSFAIEAQDGFHVLQRTEAVKRQLLATRHLTISHAAAENPPAGVTRSKEQARSLANQILDDLRADPTRYEALRRKHCDGHPFCDRPMTTTEGRGIPGIDQAVAAVQIGDVVHSVFETPAGFHLVRREDPQRFPGEISKVRFDFPRPPPRPQRDLNWILANAPAGELATATRRLAREAATALALTGADATHFTQILERFGDEVGKIPAAERAQLARDVHAEVRGLLGAERWKRFAEFENAWISRLQAN
jgi:hypothetical protein